MYYVTDVNYPILSGMRMTDCNYVGVMDKYNPHLRMPDHSTCPLIRRGTHIFACPTRLTYSEPIATLFEAQLDVHLDYSLENNMHLWYDGTPQVNSNCMINATGFTPVYYHTDYWDLNTPGLLIRRHRRPRKVLFTPLKVAGLPIPE